MTYYGEGLPAYQTIRMTHQPGPIAAFAEKEAWRARERYPQIMGAGMPTFFYTRERQTGGWEILGLGGDTPQGARDSLAAHFRETASHADGNKKLLAAAEKLDWVVVNELKVLGTRYRVVRSEPFIRMGPDGPEPPRPSDPDPARPGEAYKLPSRTKGFVIDPYTGTGISEGLLRFDLSQFVVKSGGEVPDDVYAHSVRARETHPGAVLLPAEFGIAEKTEGRWRPHTASGTTPQGARDSLAMHFRVLAPVLEKLSEEEREEYAKAADRLDEKRGAGIGFGGRRFRVIRIEQMIRIGPDGPEGPRPSDHDPEPPVGPHIKQLKADGLLREDDDDDEPLTGDALELKLLMDKEEARRAAHGVNRGREAPPQ